MMIFNSLGVLLPNSAGLVNLTKEEQKNLVAQILTEVPLIDGWEERGNNFFKVVIDEEEKMINLLTQARLGLTFKVWLFFVPRILDDDQS